MRWCSRCAGVSCCSDCLAGWVVAVGVVQGDAGAGGVAADQDPGHGPVTGQPPTPLDRQRPQPDLPTQASPALEAVQIDQHRQLGPDPTGPGQPPTLQGPPGQLGQGISPPLPPLRPSSAL